VSNVGGITIVMVTVEPDVASFKLLFGFATVRLCTPTFTPADIGQGGISYSNPKSFVRISKILDEFTPNYTTHAKRPQ